MSSTTALSGLIAAQADLSAVSHNIANSGTIGFKDSRTEFADVFSNSTYTTSRTAVGSGVQVVRVAQNFTQGPVMATGNTLDLAIEGQGFFAVQDAGGSTGTGEPIYTRSGAFHLDAGGTVVNASGQALLAWPVSIQGDVTSQATGIARPVNIPLSMGAPVATKTVSLSVDLPSDETMIGLQDAVPPTAPFDAADAATYAKATPVPMFDDAGAPMDAMAYFVKMSSPTVADPGTTYQVHLVVGGIEVPADPDVNGASQGLLSFDAAGKMAAAPAPAAFGEFNLDLTGSALSTRAFAVKSVAQDGKTQSALTSLEVDQAGTVWASYGTEDIIAMGRVKLANFTNPSGLRSMGGSSFSATSASGAPISGEPGAVGFGTLRSGSLEGSNVDLTEELVHLITAQRNYQASAKAMETSNSLMETIMNMR